MTTDLTVVKTYERRYIVEVGERITETSFYGENTTLGVAWGFHRAFDYLQDATSYAERTAEDYEFVRVIDKAAK